MESSEYVIYSSYLNRDMHIIQYGSSGVPVLGFPTQCAPCTNYEDFGVINTLKTYLEGGMLQLFCVETVDEESWYCENGINTWRSARQESYHRFTVDELIPFIRSRSSSEFRPVVMGIDMGATQASIAFFRRPELFSGLIALSGIYDSSCYYHGWMDSTLYDRGPWEDDCYRTLCNLEKILHRKRIKALIDYWGSDVSHDWPWWRHQLEYYIPFVFKNISLITAL